MLELSQRPDASASKARLDRLFAAQACATPQAPAIFHRGEVTSYRDLSAAVDRLASQLAGLGVGPGVLVALCLRRNPQMIALVLAVLASGGAYLPLDRGQPPRRLGYLLSDSQAAMLITDDASGPWEGFEGSIVELVQGRLGISRQGASARANHPSDLAYVIYTSGSSGAPKGVLLGHSATHLVDWAQQFYSPEARSRIAATTSLSFDPSVFEIFVPLCTGGALILKENALEPFAADEQPTMLDAVPSVLAELCRANALPRSLAVLNVGGEALRAELVEAVYRRLPTVALYNHYGPTEATTVATVAHIARDLSSDPAIGQPVAGAEIVLLDAAGEATRPGEIGEIHIGGLGLALGYLNRPDLTAARFSTHPRGRLYRTGDLAVWRGETLHFAGRADRQVKIRGVRVELAEVEASLERLTNVESAYAAIRRIQDRQQIVAYVQAGTSATPSDLMSTLAQWLPQAMLPARIVVMAALPRLVSGKIDQDALPPPSDAEPSHDDSALHGLEKPIVHVFEDVLGRSRVAPGDSFFDLGGDSLLSVRAALRLEEILDREIPAALLHQAPTAQLLARALAGAVVRADGHVTLLEPGGPGLPLFCMADLFGHPFNYLSLARRLGRDRPVYGVSPGPLQEDFTRNGDLRALTGSFLAALRAIQPSGPYHIAGYSSGGLLAAELASALERQGETVRLVLLDAYLHSRRPSAGALAKWIGQQLGAPATQADGPSPGVILRGVAGRLGLGAPPAWLPRAQLRFASTMIKVGARHKPPPFGGKTLLVTAKDRGPVDRLFDDDGMLGWSQTLKGAVVQAVALGGHHSFLREPHALATADLVEQFLTLVG